MLVSVERLNLAARDAAQSVARLSAALETTVALALTARCHNGASGLKAVYLFKAA